MTRTGSPPDGGGRLHVSDDSGSLTGPITIPRTGGWQAWTTLSVPIALTAGPQTLTVAFDAPGFNLQYLDVATE